MLTNWSMHWPYTIKCEKQFNNVKSPAAIKALHWLFRKSFFTSRKWKHAQTLYNDKRVTKKLTMMTKNSTKTKIDKEFHQSIELSRSISQHHHLMSEKLLSKDRPCLIFWCNFTEGHQMKAISANFFDQTYSSEDPRIEFSCIKLSPRK